MPSEVNNNTPSNFIRNIIDHDIAQNKEKIKEGREDHNHLVETVEEIQRTQNRMDRNLGRLMGAMGVEAEE